VLILAIDPASTTGLCLGEPGGVPTLSSQKFKQDETDTPEDIFRRAAYFMADFLRLTKVDLIAIEAPFPSQNFSTSMITLGLFGIFTGIAGCKEIKIMRVQISAWRKFFLSSGRMPGAQAKRRSLQVCAALGWQTQGHDSAEAAGIFSFACSQVAPMKAPRVEPLFLRGAA
jgi:hypothetical protein